MARKALFRSRRKSLSHKHRDWLSGDGHEGKGFAPDLTLFVHDRIPVILDLDNYELWLDSGVTDVVAFQTVERLTMLR